MIKLKVSLKRNIIFVTFALLIFYNCNDSKAQIGLSYFFPDKGYFSIPLAPLSYSQQFRLNKPYFIKLIPTATVYSIGGMSVSGLPEGIPNNKPLMGPFYSVVGSFCPAISIPIGMVDIDFCGGYFGAYNINPGIIQGNLDNMLMNYENWNSCTSQFSFKNNINHGFVYGIAFNIWFNDDQAITPGIFYYSGGSELNLNGTYCGGKIGGIVENKSASWKDSKLYYKGWEFQITLQL